MTSHQLGARLALAALIAGAIGISFSPIFVRLSELGPTATAFHRVFLAAPILWVLLANSKHGGLVQARQNRLGRRELWLLMASGVAFSGDLAFWHWSLQLTSVANATLLANLTPIFITLAAWLIFGEKISGLFLIGLVLALGGTATMVRASFAVDSAHVWGDLLALAAAVFYTAYLLMVKALRQSLSTLRIMTWSTPITAVCLLPIAIVTGDNLVANTWFGWLILLCIAWFSHIGGQGLIAFALAHLPASFSSVALLIQPVLAALLAWIILDEALSSLQVLSGLIVILGIALARRASLVSSPRQFSRH